MTSHQPVLNQHDGTPNGVPGEKQKTHADLSKLADPLPRLWRGDKEGKITYPSIPTFEDKYEEREWMKGHLAAAFRYWGKLGFNEGIAGHITLRDCVKPDHFWMNPFGKHYSMITKSDLVLVDAEGRPTPEGAQLPINTAGFYIHSAIHKARPDVVAAAHCHSFYGKSWSVFGRPIDILQQDSCAFVDNLSVYNSYGGVVLAAEEGENIAKALGPTNKSCILRNHGLLTLGNTIDECIYLFALLEKTCQMQLMVEAAAANGIPKVCIDDDDAKYNAATQKDPAVLYAHFQSEYELLVKETNGDFLQ
ncbi:class ii aldolase adducin domain protein [Moniliophthora roreri MCA 2997]|uniref:Class ii aldolase adducin domain protein n=1 Tax=Moniliophthora roreri (strain MCA 2997) TaxID=1381753 RepID=V2WT61_MONRO|nr:class ii aldolase adducin domain protein [Moniliophthora roreri MCA 2997]KAI3598038.1 class ii aldolase adducin domain protein [Moniliophthora roreri]